MLDKEDINSFKELWKAEYGEVLSDDVAVAEALNFLTMMNTVYRRMPQRWMDEVIAKENKQNQA